MPSIMLFGPGFGYPGGELSVITSDNPDKYPTTVPIINPARVTSENSTKDTSHVPK